MRRSTASSSPAPTSPASSPRLTN
uniref:Uncharacterized protein n=1 Tax=Arundo donax TaxID=35708 RepID=A0A0A8YFS4_ARUDO